MKRILCFVLLIAGLLSSSAFALEPLKDSAIAISSPSGILMEKETGRILYEKKAHERMAPASVTKIMTMLLIAEDIAAGKIALEDTVTASDRAASFGGSCVYLEAGEKMSVHEMLKCIAVVSANDCAVAMAEHLSGTEQLFVDRMNERAAELKLENTHFADCTGLSDSSEHYTSAYDIAVMSRALIKHEMIKEYTTIWMDSIRGGEFELSSTNKLVYWYEGCTGLKTGYTSSAMYCLAATAERDGVEFIAVIMHSESANTRNADAGTLLNYAFAHYSLCSLRQEAELPTIPVDMGKQSELTLRYDGAEYALVPKSNVQPEYTLNLPDVISAPVELGEELGSMSISFAGEIIAEVPICAAEEVQRIGFFGIFSILGGSLLGL